MNSNLLLSLLIRGDRVSIVDGRLQLQSASGRPVPDAWLKSHRDQIVFEAITALNVQAFRFHKHTTGKYQNMAGGLTTHFIDLSTDEEAFCIFNASISRARTTSHGEKGSPLPTGHFRPGKRSEFIKFWDRSGLPYPRDFSSFHERMNKLKQIIFTGTYRDQKKLEKYSVTPLTLRYDELLKVSGIQLDSVKTSEFFGKTSGTPREETSTPAREGLLSTPVTTRLAGK